MRNIILFIVICFFIGCASVPPHRTEILVSYPLEGEIVWVYPHGLNDQKPRFVINYDNLQEFIEWLEKEKSSQ